MAHPQEDPPLWLCALSGPQTLQAPGDLGPWGVGCHGEWAAVRPPLVWMSRDILGSPQAGPWKLEKRGSLLLGTRWSLGRLAACILGSLGPCAPGGEEAGWADLGVSWTSWAHRSL